MKNKNRIYWIAGGAVVVLLIVLAMGKKQGWFGNSHELKVVTEKVILRDIIESVSANGKIQPETEVKITPYISGEIVELNVKEGDAVQEGDLLAVVDPELYITAYERSMASLNTYKANEANSRARVAQVEAQYKNAELSFNRSKALWKQEVISDADYETAEANFYVAKAEVDAAKQSLVASEYSVKSAQASLSEAKENLTKTNIYAPISGTVSLLNVEKGERVSGASTFSAGTEILRIANLDIMEVNVEVNENDIIRVKLGDTCIIEVDAHMEKEFRGLVTELATSANTSGTSADQVTNFNVKVRVLPESYTDLLKNNDPTFSPLRPGMSATVDIQTSKTVNALTIPIQAVTTRPDTSGVKENDDNEVGELEYEETDTQDEVSFEKEEKDIKVVFVLNNGKAQLHVVETGIQDSRYIVITDGLEEGTEVITAPYRAISRRLKDDMDVKKVKKEDLYSE